MVIIQEEEDFRIMLIWKGKISRIQTLLEGKLQQTE